MKHDREFLTKYIKIIVGKVYTRFGYLFSESQEELTSMALNKYLDSGLTVEEINREISSFVDKRREEYENRTNPTVSMDTLKLDKKQESDSNNEINKMLSDNSNKVSSDNKKLVKSDGESQRGAISLFSIGLSLLIIIAMVLIALILNLLLK